jgi:hypothetical protein
MVTELYSADLSFVGHRHEVRDVSANGNHAVLAELPVRMDSRGFFEASVKLNFIADDIHVVDGGEFTFYWKNVGSGPELISAREYNTWLARTPVRTAPSTANLESGDVPGERVIHPPNAGHIPECGVDAVCPRRVR